MIHIIPKPTDTQYDNSTGMVIEELTRLGANFDKISIDKLDIFNIPYSGDIIWVCGIKQDGFQFELLKSLSLTNRVVNSPESIANCASKATTSTILVNAGISTPDTCFTNDISIVDDFLNIHNGCAIYKPVYGFDGNGIYMFNSIDQIKEPRPYYVQEYIKNDRDYRVFVIGNKAVGAIKRESSHLTHNIHQGGHGMAISLTDEIKSIAESAAMAMNIDYCGVDLLPTEDGRYTVLEINGTPNWHCMDAPIPTILAKYLVEQDQLTKK